MPTGEKPGATEFAALSEFVANFPAVREQLEAQWGNTEAWKAEQESQPAIGTWKVDWDQVSLFIEDGGCKISTSFKGEDALFCEWWLMDSYQVESMELSD